MVLEPVHFFADGPRGEEVNLDRLGNAVYDEQLMCRERELRADPAMRDCSRAWLAIAREQTPPPALAWCNARTSACAYYEKLGFTPRGGEFEIEGIGPHFVMVRAVLLDTAE